jgi:hypothetical protein
VQPLLTIAGVVLPDEHVLKAAGITRAVTVVQLKPHLVQHALEALRRRHHAQQQQQQQQQQQPRRCQHVQPAGIIQHLV